MQGSLLDDYVTALEAALLGYVVKYGLTDQAQAVFAARDRHLPRDCFGRSAPPGEEKSS